MKTIPLADGAFNLSDDGRSFVVYARGALDVSPADVGELWSFGMDPSVVRPTTFMGAVVRRRQATFGATYDFSGQKNTCILREEADFPVAVRAALDDARRRLAPDVDPSLLNGVHVNWYPSGLAGVEPHADAEPALVEGAPIFSYTLFVDGDAPARGFQMYDASKSLAADIPLWHGDLLVMGGETQRHFTHGVKKTSAKAFENHRRINITVRAFRV
jgi:alkylated DNA repair dioxygenase AlkB